MIKIITWKNKIQQGKGHEPTENWFFTRRQKAWFHGYQLRNAAPNRNSNNMLLLYYGKKSYGESDLPLHTENTFFIKFHNEQKERDNWRTINVWHYQNTIHYISTISNWCHNPNNKTVKLGLSTLLSRVPWGLLAILGLNAFGLRSKVASTASLLAASFSTLLKQFTQLQPSQYIPDAKHSQYLLKIL